MTSQQFDERHFRHTLNGSRSPAYNVVQSSSPCNAALRNNRNSVGRRLSVGNGNGYLGNGGGGVVWRQSNGKCASSTGLECIGLRSIGIGQAPSPLRSRTDDYYVYYDARSKRHVNDGRGSRDRFEDHYTSGNDVTSSPAICSHDNDDDDSDGEWIYRTEWRLVNGRYVSARTLEKCATVTDRRRSNDDVTRNATMSATRTAWSTSLIAPRTCSSSIVGRHDNSGWPLSCNSSPATATNGRRTRTFVGAGCPSSMTISPLFQTSSRHAVDGFSCSFRTSAERLSRNFIDDKARTAERIVESSSSRNGKSSRDIVTSTVHRPASRQVGDRLHTRRTGSSASERSRLTTGHDTPQQCNQVRRPGIRKSRAPEVVMNEYNYDDKPARDASAYDARNARLRSDGDYGNVNSLDDVMDCSYENVLSLDALPGCDQQRNCLLSHEMTNHRRTNTTMTLSSARTRSPSALSRLHGSRRGLADDVEGQTPDSCSSPNVTGRSPRASRSVTDDPLLTGKSEKELRIIEDLLRLDRTVEDELMELDNDEDDDVSKVGRVTTGSRRAVENDYVSCTKSNLFLLSRNDRLEIESMTALNACSDHTKPLCLPSSTSSLCVTNVCTDGSRQNVVGDGRNMDCGDDYDSLNGVFDKASGDVNDNIPCASLVGNNNYDDNNMTNNNNNNTHFACSADCGYGPRWSQTDDNEALAIGSEQNRTLKPDHLITNSNNTDEVTAYHDRKSSVSSSATGSAKVETVHDEFTIFNSNLIGSDTNPGFEGVEGGLTSSSSLTSSTTGNVDSRSVGNRSSKSNDVAERTHHTTKQEVVSSSSPAKTLAVDNPETLKERFQRTVWQVVMSRFNETTTAESEFKFPSQRQAQARECAAKTIWDRSSVVVETKFVGRHVRGRGRDRGQGQSLAGWQNDQPRVNVSDE